ncbi:hypothetical protein [Comamonas antarctica]|uniref:hypothetical protein n=1 Tax=Comamonas antarctica TaxID=2743470 RepID=UPI0028EB2E0A|nr:hypothetical protein [Comamonas antarctica]
MPKAIDLATVSPERAASLAAKREQKRRMYLRRKEEMLARNRAWREANPVKSRASAGAWGAANPERKAANTRAYYERNREAVLARQSRRNQDLADSVVRSRFAHDIKDLGLTCADVPDAVLPAYRATLQIGRELRRQRS